MQEMTSCLFDSIFIKQSVEFCAWNRHMICCFWLFSIEQQQLVYSSSQQLQEKGWLKMEFTTAFVSCFAAARC